VEQNEYHYHQTEFHDHHHHFQQCHSISPQRAPPARWFYVAHHQKHKN
jgi:hypothetical protein